MKKYLILALGLICCSSMAPAMAGDYVYYYAPNVIGAKARKQIRHFLYEKNLKADKKVVYDKYGYTPHRIRENGIGRVTETWTYPEVGKAFTFDREGNLIDKHDVAIESRRDWVYQR